MGSRHERLQSLFLEALEKAPEERDSFLSSRSFPDGGLVEEVKTLLEHAGRDTLLGVEPGNPIRAALPHILELEEGVHHPETIGSYRILGVLGRGGMGVVYEAQQSSPERRVAIKVLSGPGLFSAKTRARFEREIAALARISHPHIVKVFATGTVAEAPYVVMERIDGSPWSAWLSTEPPTRRRVRQILELGVKVARALDHAHEHGVVHRDVKPGNIVIDQSGEPILIDFGLVRELDHESITSEPVGTLSTMAPEQATGCRIDRRVDVFALGATLYQLLTGQSPYPARSLAELGQRFQGGSPTSARRLNRAVSNELATVLEQATALESRERYASCADLAEDLEAVLSDRPIQARRRGLLQRTARWAARRKALASALLVAGIASIGALVQGWKTHVRDEEERLRRLFHSAEVMLANDPGDGPRAVELREAALRAFRGCVDLDPSFGEGWLRVADVESRLRRDERAIAALEEAELCGQAGYCFQYLRKFLLKQDYSGDVVRSWSDPTARASWASIDLLKFAEGQRAAGNFEVAYGALALIQSRHEPLLVPEALLCVMLNEAAISKTGKRVLSSADAELLVAWQAIDALLEGNPCELTSLENVAACLEQALTNPIFSALESPDPMLLRVRQRLERALACPEHEGDDEVRVIGLRVLRSEYIWHMNRGHLPERDRVLAEIRAELPSFSDAGLARSDENNKLVELLVLAQSFDRAYQVISILDVFTEPHSGPAHQVALVFGDFSLRGAELDPAEISLWLEGCGGSEEDVLAAFGVLEDVTSAE